MRFLPNPLSQQARDFALDALRFARWRGASALMLMIAGAVLEGVGLALLVPLLAVLSGAGSGRTQALIDDLFALARADDRIERLIVVLAAFAVLLALRSVVLAARDRQLAVLQVRFVEQRRMELVRALAAAEWRDITSLRHARVTQAVGTDIAQIASAAYLFLTCVLATLMLTAQGILALLVAPAMAAVAIALIAVGAVALLPVLRRASELGRLFTGRHLSMIDTTGQFLGGLKLAIAQNLQSRFTDEFEQTTADLAGRQLAFMRQQSNIRLVIATAAAGSGAAVLLTGVWLNMEAPTLIAMLLILSRMTGPATQIQQCAQQLAHSLPAYAAVKALTLDLGRAEVEAPDVPLPALANGLIRFEGVGYRHAAENGTAGVEGLDLTLSPGEVVCVSGPSGAGKTTFADLLVGLIEPQTGRITVGGTPLSGSARAAWRDRTAYVSQDPYLFNDTLRRNLTWAAPGALDADLWDALASVGAEDLVRAMSDGLDTVVGERGLRLSGGERQRIALARALLRRPSLLVLDEATNALDPVSEKAVLDRLLTPVPRPTIVIIAHRLENDRPCGRILTFEAGRLSAPAGLD